MKRLLLIFCTILLGFTLKPTLTSASHMAGADLTYSYVGPSQWNLTLNFFRDCYGIPAPNTVYITYSSASLGINNLSITLQPLPGTGQPIPPANCVSLGATTCNGGTAYGIQNWVYQGVVTLPNVAVDWIFTWEDCCRNSSINNLSNPGSEAMHIEAFLNSIAAPTNTSPSFANLPISVFCVGNQFYYDQGAYEPDGDSLYYSLVTAQGNGGAPCAYANPYTALYPLATNPPNGVSIDNATGVISFIPSQVMIAVMDVQVDEFRQDTATGSWVLIGRVKRDMQLDIEANCIVAVPTYNPAFTISASCGDTTLTIHFAIPIQCGTVENFGTDFRLIGPSGGPYPIKSEQPGTCSNGLTTQITLNLFVPMTENGTYSIFTKVGNDNNTLLSACGTPMPEYDTLHFSITDCFSGVCDLTNVSVTYNNDSMYVQWNPPPGLPVNKFSEYKIFRSDNPAGPYTYVGNTTNAATTDFTDATVIVPQQPYNYYVTYKLTNGQTGPPSDSIQSIFLTCNTPSDTTKIDLSWTPYWGWNNATYTVEEYDSSTGSWHDVQQVAASTNYQYSKPNVAGKYKVRVYSVNLNGSVNYLSRSNWCEFDVILYHVIPVNVFTPNGDGVNDVFEITNVQQYPGSHLTVFNRWGRKVFESKDYKNDWNGKVNNSGSECPDGVYYYVLKVPNYVDKDNSEFNGTLSLFRNKK